MTMFGSSSTIRTRCAMRASGGSHQRCFARHGQAESEAGAGAGAALHPDAAAEVLDDPAGDVQTQAAALRLARQHVTRLAEFLENEFLVGRADPDSAVSDRYMQGSRL